MKLFFSTLALVSFTTFTFAQTASPNSENTNAPEIIFEKMTHDFGNVMQGDNTECVFKFKNTGKEPLIISNCAGSCGCTVPQCPKEPILPGKMGEIKVRYDNMRVGPISKSVMVVSNAKTANITLTISGNIAAKPIEQAFPVNNTSKEAPIAN